MTEAKDSPKRDWIGFEGWANPQDQARTPLASGFLPRQEELEGWKFESRWPFPNERWAFIDHFSNRARPEEKIALTVRWHPTTRGAHEGLLQILTTCMIELPRLGAAGIRAGDVGFGGVEGATGLFFTRGNILVKVESVGEKTASLRAFAEAVDRQIAQRIAEAR